MKKASHRSQTSLAFSAREARLGELYFLGQRRGWRCLAATNPDHSPAQPIDPRIGRALDFVASSVREPLSLANAANPANLSPSRFRYLFKQETGRSFRAYLLWLRINLAIEAATAGASWTEAAHAAGFSDTSHLTRTHKRMFGIEPTTIRMLEGPKSLGQAS